MGEAKNTKRNNNRTLHKAEHWQNFIYDTPPLLFIVEVLYK